MMDVDLPQKSYLYADAAYVNGEAKELLQEYHGIKQKKATKKNARVKNTWAEELENKYFRKRIENTFSEITRMFPKKIHAVTPKGFLLKILISIYYLYTK
jgi:hypothetical protein